MTCKRRGRRDLGYISTLGSSPAGNENWFDGQILRANGGPFIVDVVGLLFGEQSQN
jgi:hypothetical protein